MLKWLHWVSVLLPLFFLRVGPGENRIDPGGALSTHAGVGLLLAVTTLVWLLVYRRNGLASRPGPTLLGWARYLHPIRHRPLQYGIPTIAISGAMTGLVAPFAIRPFGTVPLNCGIGSKTAHELFQNIHDLVFNGLLMLIVLHLTFHLWRHDLLKDNALRILAPKVLHEYL